MRHLAAAVVILMVGTVLAGRALAGQATECCFCDTCCVNVGMFNGQTCDDLCTGAGCGSSTGSQVGACPEGPPCRIDVCCVCNSNECCVDTNVAPANQQEACDVSCLIVCDALGAIVETAPCSSQPACGGVAPTATPTTTPEPAGAPALSSSGSTIAVALLAVVGLLAMRLRFRR